MVKNIEEIVKKGRITIYKDTDSELVKAVHEYNANVSNSRMKKAHVNEILSGYYILNPLVICALIASSAGLIFRKPLLALICFVIFTAVFFIFAVSKKNLLISSLAVVLLCILDIMFAILLVFDIVLYILYEKSNKNLKREMGYPAFLDIYIKYENSFESKKYN